MDRIRIPRFLDIATYVSAAGMCLLGMSRLPSLQSQFLALGFVLSFGLLYHFLFRSERYKRWPGLYFGAQILILSLLILLTSENNDAFNFLFLIFSIHIAVVSTPRMTVLWIAFCFGALSVIILATRGTEGLYAVLFYAVTFVICGFFGYTVQQVEWARDRNQQLLDELQAAQQRLKEMAVVEERNRLARDLHDSVKQQVYAISMQLGAAQVLLEKEHRAYAPVTEAERLARQAGAELTTLIRELRPPTLERKTLPEALQEHVRDWSRQNGIQADLDMDGVSSIPLASEEALFRVAQEALANVARHSGAQRVKVALATQNDEIILTVVDDGAGFDMSQIEKGVGLDSMRERLEAVGGQLHISREPLGGTRVMASIGGHHV